jgi:hypothetical protein
MGLRTKPVETFFETVPQKLAKSCKVFVAIFARAHPSAFLLMTSPPRYLHRIRVLIALGVRNFIYPK